MKTIAIFGFVAACALAGCDLPGRPTAGTEVPRPESVTGFDKLYSGNCAGCHGANGRDGAAVCLANPEFQALMDDATLRQTIAHGEKGTLMPGFALESGGPLNSAQVDALVAGMRERWRAPNAFGGDTPPPWKATRAADASKGAQVYAAACASCHGATALEPGKNGSILDGSFLALIDEQTIRTTVIAGRSDIGQPDWRKDVAGHPLTDEEITNLTAWMISQKPANPGQPYPVNR